MRCLPIAASSLRSAVYSSISPCSSIECKAEETESVSEVGSVKKIGVLGGTFDPIHNAHLLLAEQARESLGLERVIFIPAKAPPHKRKARLAPAADRLRMVHLATQGNSGFAVSDIELRRRGPSYTVDTIRALKRQLERESRLFFLIGGDTIGELPIWRNIRALVRLCEIVPLTRPGAPPPRVGELAKAIGKEEARALVGRLIEMPLMDISATDIRRRVAEGRSVRYLVPEVVREYIQRKGLYTKKAKPSRRTLPRQKSCGGRSRRP